MAEHSMALCITRLNVFWLNAIVFLALGLRAYKSRLIFKL
jgi:hypothetical protein